METARVENLHVEKINLKVPPLQDIAKGEVIFTKIT